MPSPSSTAQCLADDFLLFRTRLARAVKRIVRAGDVEDILQDTFLKCYQASAKVPIRHPRAFMLTTARNLALNHIAKADNRLVTGVPSFDDNAIPLYRDAADDADPEPREDLVLLALAVRTLPRQCQRAFILKKVYGMSRREIASHMGITESTVQKHVAKGLVLCAHSLSRGARVAPRPPP